MSPSRETGRRRSIVLWGLLVFVIVWWNARDVIDFDFVAWDDEHNILLNPHLGPPTAKNVTWMFTDWDYMRRYVPFGWLGFSSAYACSGLSPSAYHVGNLLLHCANAVLLYLATAWVLRRGISAPHARILPAAAAGALFWAIHPFRAETVGWASGMLYTLACFFALLSVLAYCQAPEEPRLGYSRAWRWMSVILYTISMITYPITVGLLAVFFAIDAAEWRRGTVSGATKRAAQLRRLLLAKVPFVAAALAVSAVTVIARVTAAAFWGHAPTLGEVGMVERAMRGFYTTAYYLWKTCWPTNLTPIPTQLGSFSYFSGPGILSTLVILGITFLLLRRRERRFGLLWLWVCYIALLVPMLGLTEKVYYTSDRYTYLPAMSASIVLAAMLASLSRSASWAVATAMIGILLALARMNSAQLQIWRDTPTLFARCIELSTDLRVTADTYQRWAKFHAFRGHVSAAAAVVARAERVHGPVKAEMEADVAKAREEVRQGTAPLVARIHGVLALKLAKKGHFREADEHFSAALRIAPHFTSMRYNQAIHAAASGEPRRALGLFLTAIAQSNGSISATAQRSAWSLIAQAFARGNEPELARHAELRARLLPES